MTLIRRGNTWVEPTPDTCPNGDILGPNRVTISWDGTRRIYRCATCDHVWH
jgi:hypothetical protein